MRSADALRRPTCAGNKPWGASRLVVCTAPVLPRRLWCPLLNNIEADSRENKSFRHYRYKGAKSANAAEGRLRPARGASPQPAPAAAMSDDVPDYNSRLAFGTDQGRWLAQQVGESGRPHRRTASGGHVFHDLDSISPDPAQMASQQNPLAVDGKLQRVVTRCVETVPGLRIKTFRLAAGACAVCMMLLFLLRFV